MNDRKRHLIIVCIASIVLGVSLGVWWSDGRAQEFLAGGWTVGGKKVLGDTVYVDTIRAASSTGLKLYDALGNDGLHVFDGGDVNASGVITATALKVHGSVNITGANGIDYNPGSDTDVDIATVGVTGAPRFLWHEATDTFSMTHSLSLPGASLRIGNITISEVEGNLVIPSLQFTERVLINKTTGWLEGGQITINGGDNTKIDVSAGSILVVTGTNELVGTVISWTAQTALNPGLTTRSKWIGVKDNGSGAAEFVYDTEFDAIERRTTAILGRIWDSAGTGPQITNVGDYERPAWGLLTAFQDFVLEYGSWNISGNVYSANGVNLLLDKSAGKSFRYHAEDADGEENVHTDAAQVARTPYAYHLQGVSTIASEADIDPDNCDNGGVKTAVTANDWTIQEVWFFPVSGTCHVLYGQVVYNSKADAIAGISSETKVRNTGILDGAILRAYLILQEGATDLSDSAEAAVREAGAGAGGGGGGSIYWNRSDTNLSPAVAGDDVLLNTGETLSIADMTTGSISFFGASGLLSQDNANLFWEDINNSLGIRANSPKSPLHIKANVPGTVGSHPAGQIIIQSPDDTVYTNAAITGYESDGDGNPDQQLWYLGSESSGNSHITLLNRRNSSMHLGTNGLTRVTITGSGNVGIGTDTPTEALEVNGRIKSQNTREMVSSTTSVNTSSDTWVDVPNLVIPNIALGYQPVLIMASIPSWMSSTSSYGYFRIMAGDTQLVHQAAEYVSASDIKSITLQVLVPDSFTEETYTIKVQWKAQTDRTLYASFSVSDRSLIVWE